MKRYLKMLKIFLTVLIASGCAKSLTDFPDWNPVSVIHTKNKAFKCKLIDKVNFTFECSSVSTDLSTFSDGMFCTDPVELKNIINWAKTLKNKELKNGI